MAYDRLDPFGQHRADFRASIGHSLLYNIHRGKNVRATKPGDFMPVFRVREQTAGEKIRAAFSSRVVNKGSAK